MFKKNVSDHTFAELAEIIESGSLNSLAGIDRALATDIRNGLADISPCPPFQHINEEHLIDELVLLARTKKSTVLDSLTSLAISVRETITVQLGNFCYWEPSPVFQLRSTSENSSAHNQLALKKEFENITLHFSLSSSPLSVTIYLDGGKNDLYSVEIRDSENHGYYLDNCQLKTFHTKELGRHGKYTIKVFDSNGVLIAQDEIILEN